MDPRTDRYSPDLDAPRREITVTGKAMQNDRLTLSVADLQARVEGRRLGEEGAPTLTSFRAVTGDEMPFEGEGTSWPPAAEYGFYEAVYVWH